MAEMEELLTVAEIAEYLRLNQQTVRSWIDSGYLPAIRIGRRVRIKRSDFDALLEVSYTGNKPKTSAPPGTPTPVEGVWGGEVPEPEEPDGSRQ